MEDHLPFLLTLIKLQLLAYFHVLLLNYFLCPFFQLIPLNVVDAKVVEVAGMGVLA